MELQRMGTWSGFEWLDITDPSREELDALAKEHHINSHVVRDCLDPDHLPKQEQLDHFNFLITRVFDANVNAHLDSLQELTTKIAVFFNDRLLITIHRNQQCFLKEIANAQGEGEQCSTDALVIRMLRAVLQRYEEPVMKLGEQIDVYESTVLLKHTRPALLHGLYYIKRKAAACKKVLLLTDDLLSFLKSVTKDKSAVQDARDLYTKLILLYDQVLDDVNNLLNTYLSLTAQKTNEVMKVLTIFSAFFMPLTFIAGIYGMNFQQMPELSLRYGYPAVLISMLLVSLVIFLYFRKKRWL